MEYILVTGGLGYIGSHVVAELLLQGHSVIIVDNCSNSDESMLKAIRPLEVGRLVFYKADIRKGNELVEIFMAHKVTTVIHLAGSQALKGPPLHHFSNNVSGTISLLGAMKHFGCRRLIYGSSAQIYGNTLNPVKEQDRVGCSHLSAYAQSVLMVEQILQEQLASDPDWSVHVLRLFEVCGSMGQFPERNNILYWLKYDQEVPIHGAEHPTPDGTLVRDYIHVADVAAAFIAAIKMRATRGLHIYNIGSGKGISILEFLNCFTKVNNVNVMWRFIEPSQNDVPILYACIGKAFNELGWQPRKTLNDICAFL
jgi:UDP-glucose 4-epimerase